MFTPPLLCPVQERDGVAATAEAVLLQLQGQVEAVLDATQGPQKEIEDRVLSTEACHKLRRLCQASHSRLKQTLKTAAEADVCSHQQRGVVTPPTLFQRSASGPTQQVHVRGSSFMIQSRSKGYASTPHLV